VELILFIIKCVGTKIVERKQAGRKLQSVDADEIIAQWLVVDWKSKQYIARIRFEGAR
jgi:hypothetical protein